MEGIVVDIEKTTLKNDNFRKVLATGQHSQLVVMSLLPKEEIGFEVHPIVDQFFRIEEGMGKAIVDGVEHELTSGSGVLVLAGSKHNIINTSPDKKMKLYTIYCPAHHKEKTIHKTKADAEKDTGDHI
jgi:mannose-6-phosphate isomerase-like protein (cupin superfamily)